MTRRPHPVLLLVVGGVLLSGCTGGGEQTTPPSVPPSATFAATARPTSAESPADVSAPAPSPDPSTAGSLNADTLPQSFLGFTPDIRPPREGEFNPNGSWVFGTEPARAASETWPHCEHSVPTTTPRAALMGSYANPAGAPGIGQAFEFASASEASAWLQAYGAELQACKLSNAPRTPIVELNAVPGLVLARRTIDGLPWSERVWVDGAVVFFMVVQTDASLDGLRDAV